MGHLVCDFDKDNIAFIKNYGNSNVPSYDIANLEIGKKAVTALSELKTVTNIINMDGTLLTQEKGKYYIVKGESDYKNVDMLKAKPDAAAKPKTQADAEKEVEKELEDE